MAVTLNADPTSRLANSYVTLSMADEYFNNRITTSVWDAASDDNQKRVLIEAAKRIDSFRFHGELVWYRQRMQFPRYPYSRSISGIADAGSTTTYLIDSELADIDLYENEDWKYSGIRITDGAAQNDARLIDTFTVSNGKLTIHSQSSVFSATPDTTTQYLLIEQVPQAIRDAQCELALWLLEMQESRNSQVDPNVKSESIGDYSVEFREGQTESIVPDFVRNMLDEYISILGVAINDRMIN